MVATDVASRGIGMMKLRFTPLPLPLPPPSLEAPSPVLRLCDHGTVLNSLPTYVGVYDSSRLCRVS